MPHGVRTPIEVELEFRKRYLVTGNAAGSARAVDLPETTGQDLAKRANADPEFVAARAEMRARVLPDAMVMAMSAMQVQHARLCEDAPSPRDLAALASEFNLKSASFQDPRPAYGKNLNDAVKVFAAVERLDAEKRGEVNPTAVTINVSPTPSAAARLAGADGDPVD